MIRRIECFIPVCDICGKNVEDAADFIPHHSSAEEALETATHEADGAFIDGQLCCLNCWRFDDEDDDKQVIVRREETR